MQQLLLFETEAVVAELVRLEWKMKVVWESRSVDGLDEHFETSTTLPAFDDAALVVSECEGPSCMSFRWPMV